jgi:phosphoribosylpyrophosphate synthetase
MSESISTCYPSIPSTHSKRIYQGFFGPRVPVDNLDGGTVGVSYFGDMDLINPVIVSPDAGGVYR